MNQLSLFSEQDVVAMSPLLSGETGQTVDTCFTTGFSNPHCSNVSDHSSRQNRANRKDAALTACKDSDKTGTQIIQFSDYLKHTQNGGQFRTTTRLHLDNGVDTGDLGTDSMNTDNLNQVSPQEEKKIEGKKEQTVYPIRRYEDILAMANWMWENKNKIYSLAFIIGCNIGLRANELLQLKYNQVFDPEGNVIYQDDLADTSDVIRVFQGKTDKNRPIFLNAGCKAALEWFFPDRRDRVCTDAYLFPSREGGHIEVDTFRKVLKEAAFACGLKQNIGTHTLRKTFGYHLWMQNQEARADVTLIQAIFGHSDTRITMRYLGLDIYEFKLAYRKLRMNIAEDPDFIGRRVSGTASVRS